MSSDRGHNYTDLAAASWKNFDLACICRKIGRKYKLIAVQSALLFSLFDHKNTLLTRSIAIWYLCFVRRHLLFIHKMHTT